MLAALGSVLVVAFVLSFSGSAPSLYERELAWLFWLNVGVALLLALVLALTIGRLFVRLRTGRFGSRLLLRLAGNAGHGLGLLYRHAGRLQRLLLLLPMVVHDHAVLA